MKIEALELINVLDALLTSDFPSQLITLIPLTYDLQKFKTLKNTFEILALDDKASVVEWYLEKNVNALPLILSFSSSSDAGRFRQINSFESAFKLFINAEVASSRNNKGFSLEKHYSSMILVCSEGHLKKDSTGVYVAAVVRHAHYINAILEKNDMPTIDYSTCDKVLRS